MSQNSIDDDKLLNEFMDKYEKDQNQSTSYQTCETLRESFENAPPNNDPIQSTWSYFPSNNNDSSEETLKNDVGWKSQPY